MNNSSNDQKRTPRPFIGITFKCCNIYTRIYVNQTQTAYAGFCPKCAAKIEIKIGSGGSNSRFWTAQ